MKPKPYQKAIMDVAEDEEIVGGWATPHIPQTGVYKLLAKKRKDGVIEWAHFVQRDSGAKERIMRGEVNDRAQLDELIEIVNKNLHALFGVQLQAGDYDMYMPGAKKMPDKRH